ncbi:MAG: hypothetical protein AUJ74_03665 [Candidatus Omnitrophica bacterium CG1_02_44_16]|nr:MAG: hypothetical protein AUJ74_03665 [Candidatus Omnitrophica bacterium CG1_02_44_16]
MSKKIIYFCVFYILAGFLWITSTAFAAEVFYLGGGASAGTTGQNTSFSLSKRFHDLFDLNTDKNSPDRSGFISGNILAEMDWNNVSGNKSKSFLREGVDYLGELNLNIQEKLGGNYHFEGQWFLRRTDNFRIEQRHDLRLKQLSLKVLNDKNLFEFGDLYADFSPYVMGTSLEGLHMDLKPDNTQHYKFVASRKNEADEAADLFERYVVGFKADHRFLQDSKTLSNFRIGIQAATSQDDSSTISYAPTTKDMRNAVFSIDGEIAWYKLFSVAFELARSLFLEDEDAAGSQDQSYGTAFRVQPVLTFAKGTLRYLYQYVQPKFRTDTGSAAYDKIQHQLTWNYILNEKASLSLSENYYWDHLTGSSLVKRTVNDEKYASITFKPSLARPELTVRPYFNYFMRDSDDLGNSLEATTTTAGFSVNDRWNESTTYGFGYEYRAFADLAAHALSDYFHRFNFNIGHEQKFFNRRLYYSFEPGFDIRTTKTDRNKDVNLIFSSSGQYDISKNVVTRFGYNVIDTNSARANANFINHRTYGELDFLLFRRSNTHMIMRGERNIYGHEDGTQEYKETRAVLKVTTQF